MPSSDDAILRDTSPPFPSPADSPPSPTLTPAATPTSTPPPPILNTSALPSPTYHPQDPTKKSHARKQAPGHVPRPRNPFILFRCDFVRQHKVPKDLERDHRNISRIAGGVWRAMGEGERRPWVEMAEREKGEHRRVYPGYRYSPGGGVGAGGVGRRRKRGDVEEDEMGEVGFGLRDASSSMEGRDVRTRVEDKEPTPAPARKTNANRRAARARNLDHRWTIEDDLCCNSTTSGTTFLPYHRYIAYKPDEDPPHPQPTHPSPPPSYLTYRRSSSCPPGAPRIPAPSATLQAPAPSALLITRDDLARRPSRITMYQSTTGYSTTCFDGFRVYERYLRVDANANACPSPAPPRLPSDVHQPLLHSPSTPTSSSWSSGKSDTDTDSPFSTPSPRLRFRPALAGTGARDKTGTETGAKSFVGDFARMSLDDVGFGGFV
ncbi:hypothetical protein FPV67DRAFT_1494829 [Lyophyllum atratum]|nr:hypothetical protein FPV67DRAFT_1494829 [Lyophyllum atratum]